jgi:hypothetical protein
VEQGRWSDEVEAGCRGHRVSFDGRRGGLQQPGRMMDVQPVRRATVIEVVLTSRTEDEALALVAAAVRPALGARPRRRTMVLFEHTAGQWRTIGYRFEHLAAIIQRLDGSPRAGVCLDTCHLVASGYDIVSREAYDMTFRDFERLVGFDRLRCKAPICGWESREIARPSRTKRSRNTGSVANTSGNTSTATMRSGRVSRARQTSPMPPAPMRAANSYRPRRVPGGKGQRSPTHFTEYFVNAPPAWVNEFGPSAA